MKSNVFELSLLHEMMFTSWISYLLESRDDSCVCYITSRVVYQLDARVGFRSFIAC